MNKSELRKIMMVARENLGESARSVQSNDICQRALKRILELGSENVFCYASYSNEVQTHGLINELLKRGISVSVPHVKGKEMFAVKIQNMDELTELKMGIAQPALDMELIMKKIDAAIVPGLAFTNGLDRLGYGGGYYDRFLRENPCVRIGVCYGVQITDDVFSRLYDEKVHEIISSSKI